MAPIPRAQHLPKATETKAKPGPMPFLGHVHAEPSVGGDLAGAWAAGWEVKAATQGDACKQDTSGMQLVWPSEGCCSCSICKTVTGYHLDSVPLSTEAIGVHPTTVP